MATLSTGSGETDTINGHRVIASADIPQRLGCKPDMRVVLVDKGEQHKYDRYVVSTAARGEPGWHQGHYITDFADARAKFIELWCRWM